MLVPIALLACFCLLDRINSSPHLLEAFAGAVGALLVFFVLLYRQVIRSGRTLTYEFVPRPVHYVQFVMHTSVYVYWGWYWREVYHDVSLIAAQIVFAYALDMLLCWARRDNWVAGFGPIPIVMSTNLFLWFKDDWFYLQFLLIATGVLGKEFVKWKREGKLTHIFNPSAFSLCIFSIALIATHGTDISWGVDIATTFHRPPHIYLEIFLLGLVVQSLFRVTLVTLSAAAALYGLGLWYTGMTGDYQFIDSNIPVAVFLGLHLLTTDPATSPRRDLGKILFGAMYGAAVFAAYSGLKLIGAPEFYDKLLIVPPLNLSVRALDRFSDFVASKFGSLTAALRQKPKLVNFAWMGVWVGLFTTMTASGFLVKGKDHPGSNPAFWAHACQQGRSSSCATWVNMLKGRCQGDSATDCLQLGKILDEGKYSARDEAQAGVTFGRACDLGVQEACGSLIAFMKKGGSNVLGSACDRGDGASCFILGSLFSGGAGVPQNPVSAFELFQKSCDSGWWRGCGRLGVSYLNGQGTAVNPSLAIENFEKGCTGRNAASCMEAGQFYQDGKLGLKVEALARQRFQQACDLGLQSACALPNPAR
ncbi:MAG TPA: tetratricopeptide repeat protein [Bryobacteraceae bacterium]|nr:tetratricopeptide repeat protein [Bryobacteraceae bacterium]